MDTNQTVTDRIAANVRRAAADRRMSKVALAAATGIPYSTLKSRMSGRRGAFSATDILALCEALNVEPGELLGITTEAVSA